MVIIQCLSTHQLSGGNNCYQTHTDIVLDKLDMTRSEMYSEDELVYWCWRSNRESVTIAPWWEAGHYRERIMGVSNMNTNEFVSLDGKCNWIISVVQNYELKGHSGLTHPLFATCME